MKILNNLPQSLDIQRNFDNIDALLAQCYQPRGTFSGNIDELIGAEYSGSYWIDISNVLGTQPVSSGNYFLEVIASSENSCVQIARIYDNCKIYSRIHFNNQWYDWHYQNEELEIHKSSSDHDERYFLKTEGDALKKSVSDGKTAVATAITAKGVTTATNASFETLSDNIALMGTNQYNAGMAAAKIGTATANDVLAGKTFTNTSSIGCNGTMVNRGAWTGSTSDSGNVTIPAGYHNGSGYVSGAGAYNTGYQAGVNAADGRVNTNSSSYSSGYNNGYNAGVSAADGRVNTNSSSYSSGYNNGYNAGVSAADARVNTGSASYSSGYNNGKNDGYTQGRDTVVNTTATKSASATVGAQSSSTIKLTFSFANKVIGIYDLAATCGQESSAAHIKSYTISGNTVSVKVYNHHAASAKITVTAKARGY